MGTFKLAPKDHESVAGLICSFDSHWREPIQEGLVKVVFRKKKLVRSIPEWLYAYMNSPVSSITARMRIAEASVMATSEAIDLAAEGDIPAESLRSYAGSYAELFVFRVKDVEVAKVPISKSILASKYAFCPTPNFIHISERGVETLDALGQFEPRQ